MTRVAVVEQPNYIPWIGYFDLIRRADVRVWYDDVQYTKRDWRNRNRVETGWLTIPVKTKGRFTQRICDVEIDDSADWKRRHLETIRRCYAHAPFLSVVMRLMEDAFAEDHVHLADLTIVLNETICARIGIGGEFLRSSRLPHGSDERQERLLDLCRSVGANVYLSGPAAQAYIDPRRFDEAGIELRYMTYDDPPYERGPNPFVPNLSVIDVLAWLGPSGTAAYLTEVKQ